MSDREWCFDMPHNTIWRLFIIILRESKWGTLKSAGNPRCAVHAEIRWICTDRRDPGPNAGLQVSPTSDTCQSVAILMNRRHCINGLLHGLCTLIWFPFQCSHPTKVLAECHETCYWSHLFLAVEFAEMRPPATSVKAPCQGAQITMVMSFSLSLTAILLHPPSRVLNKCASTQGALALNGWGI